MKALVLTQVGTPYTLHVETDIEIPEPAAGEVRIKVMSSSINPVDYKFAKNGTTLQLPHILGIDAAGIVDAVGHDVTTWRKGDRVISLTNLWRWGGFAEYVVVDANSISAIPEQLDFNTAATIPCAGITAWQALYRKAPFHAGQQILVNGAGGGVGGFVVQLAKLMGLEVYATASSEPERIKALGADHIINYKQDNIIERIHALTEGRGVDAVIDLISSETSLQLATVLRHNGHLISVSGRIDQNPIPSFTKAISIHEVALGFAYQHGDDENLRDIAAGGEFLATLMANGKLDPMIQNVITLDELENGLHQAEHGKTQGKVVIEIAKAS
ncbi:zinc-binding dehydrogenase [uncultured Acinetobacter sp.]|uniref:zinc-binding dehydrogenase n=1 Tax=uncultured Acinetobacter sp. TaxID=165433 RepID=UPI00258912F7|nr:zinc-binding dehydrogenase [uncultured Acinetobacter sp.]